MEEVQSLRFKVQSEKRYGGKGEFSWMHNSAATQTAIFNTKVTEYTEKETKN
jgi:hypothetical protein